jgi:hypothetical protein
MSDRPDFAVLHPTGHISYEHRSNDPPVYGKGNDMTSPNAPHIHSIRNGGHTDLYIHEPGLRWTHVDLAGGAVHPGGDLPPDSQQLFSSNEVEEILDSYRSSLEAALGTSPEGMFDVDRIYDATEVVEALPHSDLKGAALGNALCPDD